VNLVSLLLIAQCYAHLLHVHRLPQYIFPYGPWRPRYHTDACKRDPSATAHCSTSSNQVWATARYVPILQYMHGVGPPLCTIHTLLPHVLYTSVLSIYFLSRHNHATHNHLLASNARHALRLANAIADSRYMLYSGFAGENGCRPKEYLAAMRTAVLAGLEHWFGSLHVIDGRVVGSLSCSLTCCNLPACACLGYVAV
jgi:hypothetical protein